MIMWLIFGAAIFASVYTGLGAQEFVSKMIAELPLGRWGIFILMQLILLFLGCLMDPAGIIMITVPIFVPIVRTLGFDPVWYGIIFTMNMEIGFLTPPFGFNLFFMRSVTPKHINMADIYRAAIPFVGLQALSLAIVAIFPEIGLFLPSKMVR